MITMRPSVPADVPRQRELWKLAFGDDGAYVDNFYNTYYRPERVIVLEEDGRIQAMTAWFDTTFVDDMGKRWKMGYLYAVATDPKARGRGYAGALLGYADAYLKEIHHCQGVTTVPAEESLHNFFASNGFRECFTHDHLKLTPATVPDKPSFKLTPLSPARYGQLREQFLEGIAHIVYPEDALEYQAGCCRVSGGGFYLADLPKPVVLCAEGMADGTLLIKELLGTEQAKKEVFSEIFSVLPNFSGGYRTPGSGVCFGMLKWLDPEQKTSWNWGKTAYMGLGFD